MTESNNNKCIWLNEPLPSKKRQLLKSIAWLKTNESSVITCDPCFCTIKMAVTLDCRLIDRNSVELLWLILESTCKPSIGWKRGMIICRNSKTAWMIDNPCYHPAHSSVWSSAAIIPLFSTKYQTKSIKFENSIEPIFIYVHSLISVSSVTLVVLVTKNTRTNWKVAFDYADGEPISSTIRSILCTGAYCTYSPHSPSDIIFTLI